MGTEMEMRMLAVRENQREGNYGNGNSAGSHGNAGDDRNLFLYPGMLVIHEGDLLCW